MMGCYECVYAWVWACVLICMCLFMCIHTVYDYWSVHCTLSPCIFSKMKLGLYFFHASVCQCSMTLGSLDLADFPHALISRQLFNAT